LPARAVNSIWPDSEMTAESSVVSGNASVEQIFLARHGQTEWNLAGRRQGQLDSPLTPAGVASATRLAQLLRRQEIDADFTSPLGRAVSTATLFADALGLEVELIDELQEVHHVEDCFRREVPRC
jgi:broad specificity phosphatase PhoE